MNSINPQLIGRIQSALERTKFPPFNFKLNQLKCLSHLLDGHDVIGVLPTGFGKSLIYQLLPLILPQKRNRNILLVVAPLSSIILDQATILEERGITYSYCYIFEYNIFVWHKNPRVEGKTLINIKQITFFIPFDFVHTLIDIPALMGDFELLCGYLDP